MSQKVKPIQNVMLKLYHYPLDVDVRYFDGYEYRRIHAFYFKPRIFSAGRLAIPGVTASGLRKAMEFVERKLESADVTAEVIASITIGGRCCEVAWAPGTWKTIKVSEVRNLYNELYTTIKLMYNAEPSIMIMFKCPVKILLSKEEVRRLYEELLKTDSLLNCETAKALFGKEFAEIVSQHNREVRQKRQQKK